jgi:hypothetical protein
VLTQDITCHQATGTSKPNRLCWPAIKKSTHKLLLMLIVGLLQPAHVSAYLPQ